MSMIQTSRPRKYFKTEGSENDSSLLLNSMIQFKSIPQTKQEPNIQKNADKPTGIE